MAIRNTTSNYGSVSKFFHWTVFILVTLMLCFGFFLHLLPSTMKATSYNLHKLTGLGILLLMILRSIWTIINPKPTLPKTVPLWEVASARISHLLLYVLLLIMPLSGWIMASAANKPPVLLGQRLMLPIYPHHQLKHMMNQAHEIIAWLIIITISIHICAALRHHFVLKNNVLKRMLPFSSTN